MNLLELQKKGESNLQKIYEKAWENESFKQSLINEPVATLEKITKGDFQLEGVKIQVNDQSDPSTLYLNIPANPQDLDMPLDIELSEEDLELIAGGGKVKTKVSYLWGLIEVEVEVEW